MPVKSDQTLGWTRRTAAVSVLLAMEEHRKEAGLRLARLREARGMTQEDLAHAAEVSVKTISRFENGHHDGRRGTIKKIAKALDISEQDVTGPPPAPLGLGVVTSIDDRVERMERRLAQHAERIEALVAQQNELLQTQSEILEGLKRSQMAIEELLGTQLSAARQMESAAAKLKALEPLPPAPEEDHLETPRKAS